TKISGTCGRLMCCLKYEQDAYEDLIRTSPKLDSFVDTPEGRGTVTEVDLLRQRVKVRMEENPDTISTFANADIAVLRSGKAKKNDPPIPADLAPISGGGKRTRKEPEEEKPLLEPIRFRYSTEKIVDEPVPQESAAPAESKPSRSRRRKTSTEGAQEAGVKQADSAPKQEKPKKEPPKTGEGEGDQPQKIRRRSNNRRRKPQKPSPEA
ncbi:MAG: hypothetical protein ACI4PH_01615, partial [Faecousia sp.]